MLTGEEDLGCWDMAEYQVAPIFNGGTNRMYLKKLVACRESHIE